VTVLQSTAAAAKELSGISREYFEFLRQQLEGTMKGMNDLWGCRTPHDLAAVHSELMRETVETAVQSGRKMADISVKAAENAAKYISQNANRRAA
jgi:phasin family protein